MKLVYLCLAWLLGIYLGSLKVPWLAVLAALIIASASALLFRHRKILFLSFLCLMALSSGILRFQASISPVGEKALQFYNDRGLVEVKGVVTSDPEVKAKSTLLRLEAKEIRVKEAWRKVSGAALIYAPKFPGDYANNPRSFPYYRYGDLIYLKGELETPPELEEFNYREYLARRGIHSIIYSPKEIKLISGGHGSKFLGWIYEIRERLSLILERTIHEPQGSLAQAILLGKRGTLPAELKEDFVRSGTAHIIAISGLHISIVAGIILSLGIWIFGRHRPTYFLLALGVVWLYTVITGWRASALRAAIMASLWLLGDWVGRPNNSLNFLLLAAAIMVGVHPGILGDASFQLSFAAMAGLIFLAPRFQEWGRKVLGEADSSGKALLRFVIDSASFTLGAILTTLPLVAFYFHRISLVALPATFFVLPAVSGIIVSAALTSSLGLLLSPLAQVLGWITWLFTSYVVKVAQLFSALKFASLNIEMGLTLLCTYYLGIALTIWLLSNRKRLPQFLPRLGGYLAFIPRTTAKLPLKWVVPPLLLGTVLIWTAALTNLDSKLHVFFLDVGQGDAILLQKGTKQILIDGGPSPETILTRLGEKLPFWDRSIELVVLTHPEADHITGLVEVIRHYKVKQILTSGQACNSAIYKGWLKVIREKGIKRIIAQAGQRIELGEGAGLEILHPPRELLRGTSSDPDNNSVVLRLVYGQVSFLLTGDIYSEGEQCLLERGTKLQSTVLKVAHHGAGTSTSPQFLKAVNPEVAVISVGAENPFGHPDPEVLKRLVKKLGKNRIYLTSEHGTIEFTTDGEKLWVKTEK